jgi:peptidoglycan biosynthesis protein MviN/MurJ (putative lipid II flippase)
VAGSAALTAASLLASMGLGAVLAVLVLLFFGKNVRTDAFFAAYGVFAILNALGQSLRVTVVPRLVEADDADAALDRFLAAVLLMSAAAAIPLVLFGGRLAAVLVSSLGPVAEDTARVALLLLWVAGSLQLLAGLLAGALGARGRFAPPAVAYVAGSVTAIVSLVALAGPVGIHAVSGALALAAAVAVGLLLRALHRDGYRPAARRLGPSGGDTRSALMKALPGSLPYVVVQITYVISLAYAARLGEGEVTLYSYAFFAALLVVGATGGPASMVLAAPLAQSWNRDPASLNPHLVAVTRAGLLLGAPMVAAIAFVGDEVLDLLLGTAVNAVEGDRVVAVIAALSGFVIATLANSVPMVAGFVASRYGTVAILSALSVLVHLALTALAVRWEALPAIGLAASVSTAIFLGSMILLLWGRGAGVPAWLVLREVAQVGGAALLGFGTGWFGAVSLGGGVWQPAGLAMGGVAFAALVRLLPGPWGVARQLAQALAGGRRRPGAPLAE